MKHKLIKRRGKRASQPGSHNRIEMFRCLDNEDWIANFKNSAMIQNSSQISVMDICNVYYARVQWKLNEIQVYVKVSLYTGKTVCS